jgi:PAS domain S-box-containing protein
MARSYIARIQSQRRRAEEALREREELDRLLMEDANDFIRLHDLDGQSVFASPSVERLYGQVPNDVFEFAHPVDIEHCQVWWKHVLAGGKDRLDWRTRDASGSWRWLETSGLLVQYQGRPHVLTVCRDITERRRAEDALREREELLFLLTESRGCAGAASERRPVHAPRRAP